MRPNWSLAGLLATVVCLYLAVVPARAIESPRFPQEIMNSTDALNAGQLSTVEEAVKSYVQQMITAKKDEDVVVYRDALLDPLGQGGRPPFNQAYIGSLERYLSMAYPPAAAPPVSALVRFNVMILVNGLINKGYDTGSGTIPLILLGLTDQRPGGMASVYWAGRAAEALTAAGSVNAADTTNLVKALVGAMGALEKAAPAERTSAQAALCSVNRALAQLGDDGAKQVLAGAERRFVNLYSVDPSISMAPEREGLVALYLHWASNANTPAQADIIRIGNITYRYVERAAKLGDMEDKTPPTAPESAQPELKTFIRKAVEILTWAVQSEQGQGAKPIPPATKALAPLLDQRPTPWANIRLIIKQDWGEVIKAAPFSYKP